MPGLHNNIDLLTLPMQQKVNQFFNLLQINGIAYIVMETLRDQDVQDAYYAQGRLPLDQVNTLRTTAKLLPIDEKQNENIITHAKVSYHTSGKAIDMPPKNTATNGPWWNAPAEVWEKMADLAESIGLEAGYHWTDFKDPDHFQLD
jgi:peptidoglycan LD-endopeptidase CwlK